VEHFCTCGALATAACAQCRDLICDRHSAHGAVAHGSFPAHAYIGRGRRTGGAEVVIASTGAVEVVIDDVRYELADALSQEAYRDRFNQIAINEYRCCLPCAAHVALEAARSVVFRPGPGHDDPLYSMLSARWVYALNEPDLSVERVARTLARRVAQDRPPGLVSVQIEGRAGLWSGERQLVKKSIGTGWLLTYNPNRGSRSSTDDYVPIIQWLLTGLDIFRITPDLPPSGSYSREARRVISLRPMRDVEIPTHLPLLWIAAEGDIIALLSFRSSLPPVPARRW
jgi:hypothetical protein